MANQPPTKKFSPKCGLGSKEKTKKENEQFEFCKVCKLNHNLGRRHNYFPNHIKSLSSFLSNFQFKLSEVRFFLRNPSVLRPEHASRNRLWCVFCDVDIDEVGISFACDNAINHLASADHFRNVKGFMWKYGGGMDRVDSLRVSEADLAKYEKKCISLECEAAAEPSNGPVVERSNNIHNNVSSSEFPRVTAVGTCLLDYKLYLHASTQLDTNTRALSNTTGYVDSQLSIVSNVWKSSANGYSKNGVVYCNERKANGDSSSISSTAREGVAGNVHSGALPPWLDTAAGDVLGVGPKHSLTKTRKSKLNPNRVGAAWAEQRKIEMEMEKRGELPHNNYDSNWLPNFGGVWQSGSRKESRKEFEVEGKRPFQEESQSEIPMNIQPCISKRTDGARWEELRARALLSPQNRIFTSL